METGDTGRIVALSFIEENFLEQAAGCTGTAASLMVASIVSYGCGEG